MMPPFPSCTCAGLRRGIFHQRVSTVPAGAAQPRRHPSLWCMDDDILPMCTGFRSLAGKRRGAPPLRIGVEPVSSTVAGNSTSSTKVMRGWTRKNKGKSYTHYHYLTPVSSPGFNLR